MTLAFEAGPLRLELPDEASGADAVAAALALAQHEPLLAALEAWTRRGLDPAPVSTAAPSGLLWAQAGAARVGLAWPLLAGAPAAAPPLLRWPALAFEVEVAGFAADPLPAGADGGVLLLPPSFETPWRAVLHAAEPALACEAEWRGPGSELALCAPPGPPSARAPWRVVLDAPLAQPVPCWLGWLPNEPFVPGDEAWLAGPGGTRRRGRIAPALGGFGFWPG